MDSNHKWPVLSLNLAIILILAVSLTVILPFFEGRFGEVEADLISPTLDSPILPELIILQENSLASLSSPTGSTAETVHKIKVVITAYSSTPWETDGSPYITASGSWVRDGIIANNLLPFGTKIKIPELYGDKIFVVEDRMSWKKSNYHVDIWFPDYWEALNFGAKRTYIEIF